jgi:uncharacterized protein (DUF433 family)
LAAKVTAGLICGILQPMSDLLSRITVNPAQCGGRPCIRGMRIRVMDILDMLSGGMTQAEILADYDELEAEDIAAALTYAARAVSHPVLAAE